MYPRSHFPIQSAVNTCEESRQGRASIVSCVMSVVLFVQPGPNPVFTAVPSLSQQKSRRHDIFWLLSGPSPQTCLSAAVLTTRLLYWMDVMDELAHHEPFAHCSGY